MRNEEVAPTGRPAGAQAWAGLANLFYWIDRENGVGGFWATQIFPFGDPVSFAGYLDFETAVYDHLSATSVPRRFVREAAEAPAGAEHATTER
jgi:methyl acetate hydrolase